MLTCICRSLAVLAFGLTLLGDVRATSAGLIFCFDSDVRGRRVRRETPRSIAPSNNGSETAFTGPLGGANQGREKGNGIFDSSSGGGSGSGSQGGSNAFGQRSTRNSGSGGAGSGGAGSGGAGAGGSGNGSASRPTGGSSESGGEIATSSHQGGPAGSFVSDGAGSGQAGSNGGAAPSGPGEVSHSFQGNGETGAPAWSYSQLPLDWLSQYPWLTGAGGNSWETCETPAPPVVPEPSTAALFAMGLAGYCWRRRRLAAESSANPSSVGA